MRFAPILVLGFVFAAGASGCSDDLATGYKPRKLGVTDDERRAYYAPPFSPEAMAPHQGGGVEASAGKNLYKPRRPTGD